MLQLWIDTTLETVRRIGLQAIAAGTTSDAGRSEEGAFQKHITGYIGAGTDFAAHDAGQRQRPGLVGDQQGFRVQLHHDPVQQFQAIAGPGATHLDTAGQPVQVEGMHRLAKFQHHVVGYVHQRSQTAQASAAQAFLHPQRRLGGRIDVADDPTHITRTIGQIEQGHRKRRVQHRLHRGSR